MRRAGQLTAAAAAICLALGVASAGVVIEPRDAPEFHVSDWINADPGPVSRLRGKIVLVNFFQLWCPESNDFAVPLFNRWQEIYGGRDDMIVIGVHTVFEGHDVQTPERLRAFVAEHGMTYPVGIDDYTPGDPEIPVTMRRFETLGTPHVVIIDKQGQIRFSHFGRFDPDAVEAWIDRLLDEAADGGDRRRSRRPSGRRR